MGFTSDGVTQFRSSRGKLIKLGACVRQLAARFVYIAILKLLNMTELFLYKQKIDSIFDLLGTNENDISFSLGLGFSKVPAFLELFLRHINITTKFDSEAVKIKLQEFERDKGFTDFEIEQEEEFSVVVEAKKGWNYPDQVQLDKYSSKPSFNSFAASQKKLVVFTESSPTYTAAHYQIKTSNAYDVVVVTYKELWTLAKQARTSSSNFQKKILDELITYLQKIMTMQNIYSNEVFVVSLNYGKEEGWDISWIDIVKQRKQYFHSIGGNGFPKEPPNYIAFRYHGKLQSIHFIESYDVFQDPHTKFNEIPSANWGPHYLYYLSEPIIPSKEIRTGNIYRNGKVWAMLDLLLTSDTIAEARNKTQEREAKLK